MSEEKKAKDDVKPAPGKGRIVAILGLVGIVGVSSVAGAALSPVIGARFAPPSTAVVKPAADGDAKGEGEDEPEEKDPKKQTKALVTLDPLVVDLRDQAGETHHLKIGTGVEVYKELPEEEGRIVLARARDAMISYLRGVPYEDVADPARFENLRNELGARVLKSFGKTRAKKMLITEYVVQ